MNRWRGRVALVTGASSVIGATISKILVKKGMVVIGAARRIDKIVVSIIIQYFNARFWPFPLY